MPYRHLYYYQIQIVSVVSLKHLLCYSKLLECLQSTFLEAFPETHHKVCSALGLGLDLQSLEESFVNSIG